jgi:ABC-type phosphate/phosphonate transport system substrate-binding protein
MAPDTNRSGLLASLPMYDLPEVTVHTDLIWTAISTVLRNNGIDAPHELVRDIGSLADHWLEAAVLLSHTCGYPAVTSLRDRVDIVGSWSTVVDEPGQPGWYRTVIVARENDQCADDLRSYARTGLRLCANGPDSLSGWVSLGQFLHDQPGLADALLTNEVPVVVTGGHFNSIAAVQDAQADIASIDPWSMWLLSTWRNQASRGLRIIGHGPTVAVTPLMTALGGPVDQIRHALEMAVSDSSLAASFAALGITGFVAHGIESHEPVLEIAHCSEPTIGLLRREKW